MSWWAQTIANSLRLDEDEDDKDGDSPKTINNANDKQHNQQSDPSSSERGVKEDLSELTKTLTRQFWGFASFLAPPPQSEPSPPAKTSDSVPIDASASGETSDPEATDTLDIAGIRNDIAEIGGKFRSGISKLSSNIAVSEFTKIASNFLQLAPDQEDYGSVVGVSEEVVAFARDIAMHPETWLDFPLPDDNDDVDEFDMSDAQQEHALAVEHLAPRLAALRMELCPGYMSEGCFWMIYFVLLHPRLNKHDAELLSAPEIVKARAMLTQELQNQTNTRPEQGRPVRELSQSSGTRILPHEKYFSVPSCSQPDSIPLETFPIKPGTSTSKAELETDKHPIRSSEVPMVDKSVIEEGPVNRDLGQNSYSGSSFKVVEEKFEDDVDDWLKEESSDVDRAGTTAIPIENEEDVSFSDLEEDDGDVSTNRKRVTYGSDSSTKESRDWVQLSRSSTDSTKDINTVGSEQVSAQYSDTKECNDWLDLEEIDVE